MNLFKPLLLLAAAIALAGCTSSAARHEYKAEVAKAERDYDAAKRKCDKELSGNAEEVCEQEAKAERERAKAAAEANRKQTPKSRYEKRLTEAEADYKVAKQRCEDLAGDNKDACQEEAKAAYAREKDAAVADYKAERTSTN